MTKAETMQALSEAIGSSQKEAEAMVDALMQIAYKEVKENGEFTFPGLGKLVKAHRKARQGRNPATGETIQIAAKDVLKFKVAKAAKDGILEN